MVMCVRLESSLSVVGVLVLRWAVCWFAYLASWWVGMSNGWIIAGRQGEWEDGLVLYSREGFVCAEKVWR